MSSLQNILHDIERTTMVHIRWLILADKDRVLEIEKGSFEYPWTEEDFLRALRQRNIIGMVAERGDAVLAFMIYELHKSKLHLANFAVDPDYRRHRIGTQMISKLCSKLASHRRTHITTQVRESNLAGQLFLRKCGFRCTKVERDYYDDTREDAYLMRYTLPPQEEENEDEILDINDVGDPNDD